MSNVGYALPHQFPFHSPSFVNLLRLFDLFIPGGSQLREYVNVLRHECGQSWMLDLSTVFYSFQTSLPYPSGGEMRKASLGLPLIPPVCKAGNFPLDSAAGSLGRSPQMDLQESLEMR